MRTCVERGGSRTGVDAATAQDERWGPQHRIRGRGPRPRMSDWWPQPGRMDGGHSQDGWMAPTARYRQRGWSNARLQRARQRALEHVLVEELKLVIELRGARIRLRDDRGDVTHHVAKDGGAHEHRDDGKATLHVRVGRDVAVANGRQRRHRPVERRDVCAPVVGAHVAIDYEAVSLHPRHALVVAALARGDADRVPDRRDDVRDVHGDDAQRHDRHHALVDREVVLDVLHKVGDLEEAHELEQLGEAEDADHLERGHALALAVRVVDAEAR
eukprot:5559184-Prymnesium_polylepis.1